MGKREKITIEVEKGKKDTFLAMLFYFKRLVNEKGLDTLKRNYIDPQKFEEGNHREYWEMLRKFIEPVYMESLKNEQMEYNVEESRFNFNVMNKKGRSDELSRRVKNQLDKNRKFIDINTALKSKLEESRIQELCKFMSFLISRHKPIIIISDQYQKAIKKDGLVLPLTSGLSHVLRMEIGGESFGRFNPVYYDKITIAEKRSICIRLCVRIINKFPEFEMMENQFRIISGYILSHFEVGIETEEEYLSQRGEEGKKYIEYLSRRVKSFLDKA